MIRWVVGLTAAALCIAASCLLPGPSVASAGPQPVTYPGAVYEGLTNSPTDIALVDVGEPDNHLIRIFDSFRGGLCSNGATYASQLGFQTYAGISSAGISAFRSAWKPETLVRDGRLTHGRERQTGELRFLGNELVGSVNDEFSGHGLLCRATLKRLILFRSGTRRAPLRSRFAETGPYSGERAEVGVRVAESLVTSGGLYVHVGCVNRDAIDEHLQLMPMKIHGDRFASSGPNAFTTPGGYRVDGSDHFAGRLIHFARSGEYVADLTFSIHVVIDDRAGQYLTTCSGVDHYVVVGPDRPTP